jgi:hypothetical protein
MSTKLPTLNELDQKVLAAMTGQTDVFDAYGYPARSAVQHIATMIGKDPDDQNDLNEIYYSLKYLKMRLPTLTGSAAWKELWPEPRFT